MSGSRHVPAAATNMTQGQNRIRVDMSLGRALIGRAEAPTVQICSPPRHRRPPSAAAACTDDGCSVTAPPEPATRVNNNQRTSPRVCMDSGSRAAVHPAVPEQQERQVSASPPASRKLASAAASGPPGPKPDPKRLRGCGTYFPACGARPCGGPIVALCLQLRSTQLYGAAQPTSETRQTRRRSRTPRRT